MGNYRKLGTGNINFNIQKSIRKKNFKYVYCTTLQRYSFTKQYK